MSIKQVVPGLYIIPLGAVNAFLIDSEEPVLIDTGYHADHARQIVAAVETVGKEPADIKHILVTHCHPDHAGGLAELKRLTGAPATMHPIDAAIVKTGYVPANLKPAPGLINNLLFRLFIGFKSAEYEAVEVEHKVNDGDELPVAGGLCAIHVPGHCAGQLAFLWSHHDGVLFAADTAANVFGLGYSLGYENLEEGQRSLAKLAALDFQVACFGHGKPIIGQASAKFRDKWGTQV